MALLVGGIAKRADFGVSYFGNPEAEAGARLRRACLAAGSAQCLGAHASARGVVSTKSGEVADL